MIPKTDLEYIELYADKLKSDNRYFKEHKMLIDSQIKSSRELFRKRFGIGETFKKNARAYLKEIGIL